MGNPNQRIIVVNKNVLFGNDYFEGFRLAEEIDYESRILKNFQVMRRGSTSEPKNHPEGNAELNSEYKQPIGYSIVFNPEIRKIFAYKRSLEDKNYGETRLQGKWSWGFGGHIEPFDTKNGNPIRQSILREVQREEIKLKGEIYSLRILGYINNDSDSVGKVHFGMLYLFTTNAERAEAVDPEIAEIRLCSVKDLESLCSSQDVKVEEWSRIALEPLRKLL